MMDKDKVIYYEGKFNNKVNAQDEKVKLIGSMFSLMFITIAIIFIIIDRPILMYISVFSLIICLIVFIYFIPRQIDEKFKNLSRISPFLKIDDDNGITHGDVTVGWDKVERIAVIGETDSIVNGFSTNSSNRRGNKIIVLLNSDVCERILDSNSSPMFKKDGNVCLMDIDLMYVCDPVDLVEKLFEITFDKKAEILYTNDLKNAEKFLED